MTSANPGFRFTVRADRAAVQLLVSEFACEHRRVGSVLPPTLGTVNRYMKLWDSYMSGSLVGCGVMAEEKAYPVGLAFGGENWDAEPRDSDLGRTAYVWMVYVRPAWQRAGVGLGMLHYGYPFLLENGFESCITHVRWGNGPGELLARAFKIEPFEMAYKLHLPKE